MKTTGPRVKAIVLLFGGLSPFAREIGAPVSTCATWLANASIPAWRWPAIEQAAVRLGLELPPEDAAPTSEAA